MSPAIPVLRNAGLAALVSAILLGPACMGAEIHSRDALSWQRGESIYRLGRLPSGVPIRAVVSGDVPLQGASAACVTCHFRSGMGSIEGTAQVPPIAGRVLFAHRTLGRTFRPGYDEATLARALRDGIDSAGRPLDPLMPRYALEGDDLADLTKYLRRLAAETSPGVSQREIRFATVVTPDADPAARKATLDVLAAYVSKMKVQTRNLAPWARNYGTFRAWSLETWNLDGPPETWAGQLDERYARKPVFALLSGIGGAEWGPVHEFCERHEVPCILPNVDVIPEQANTGLYSLYFSKGIVLEAETIAAEISRGRKGGRVVQYLLPNGAGKVARAALRSALVARGNFEIRDVEAGPDGWPAIVPGLGPQIAVLWLPADQIGAVTERGKPERWSRVFVSSTLLRGEPAACPRLEGIPVDLVHPYTPPAELDRRFVKDLAWLGVRGVPPGERRIQDQTLAACMVTGDALSHVVKLYDRDFFLEFVDHIRDEALSAFHSRLSFGPGQRILQRGCYLVRDGGNPPRWVIP